MRGPSRFALFTLSGLLGPGLVSGADTCNSPTWTTPGPWDSVTIDAGTITLCPAFCVHFELNTVGASDDEYDGLMILDDSGWTPTSSPDDLSGKIAFWFGEGNAFGFGIKSETEWFTPALYSERKAYSVTFCLDTVSKAASIQVDDDVYTDPTTEGRTWTDYGVASLWPDFPMTGNVHMLYTGTGDTDFAGTVTSMTATPQPTPGDLGGSDGAETRSITFYTLVAATVLYLVF